MPMFAMNPVEVQNGYNNAAAQPYEPLRDSGPGFFEGSLTALPTGFQQGGAESALLLSPPSQKPKIQNYLESIKPNPQTTGWLANVLQGVGSIVPPGLVGAGIATVSAGPEAAPVGAALAIGETKGFATMKDLQNRGVDEATAAKVGVVEGVTQGMAPLIPVSAPGSMATRILTGGGINVGIGAAQRGATAKILDANGYKEMADQYHMLDTMQMFTDFTIGGMFGALHTHGHGEPLPSQVDAALAANNIHQLELDSAPGIPVDLATRNAHVDAMTLAAEQLSRDERVNVALPEANFIFHEINIENATAWRDAIHEHGLDDIPFDHTELQAAKAQPTTEFKLGELVKNKYTDYTEIGKQDRAWLESVVADLNQTSSGQRIFVNNENAPGQTVTGTKADTPKWFQDYNKEATAVKKERARLTKKNATLPDDRKQPLPPSLNILTREKVAAVADKMLNKKPLGKEEGQIAHVLFTIAREGRDENARQITQFREDRAARAAAEDEASTAAMGDREAAREQAAEITAGEKIAAENPDLQIPSDNGSITAAEAMALADEEIDRARSDAQVFEAAVSCFLKGGL